MNKLILGAVLAVSVGLVLAQDSPAAGEKTLEQQLEELNWLQPGSVGRIADKAEYRVREGYSFLDAADTDTFLKLKGNPPPGNSYTIASTKARWFGTLQFSPEGYVKDDEKIDAAALLKMLKESDVEDNEQRRKQGYPALTLEGWFFPPRYDTESRRLEWALKLRSEGVDIANVSTKILGRSGYTSAILVTSPEDLEKDLADFKLALKDFNYVSGEKYSEWRQGDKVAAYGLGALVLGGVAAVATSKIGFKAIAIAVVSGLAALWAGVKRFVLRRK